METVANWSVRPVFITSTFQDMQAERDWLWDFVRPAIEDRLRRHRCHLEWIDLRLGAGDARAETEAEREAEVLKVCLDEVRRSRPFLIALIGDRYGWVPPHDRAKAAAEEAAIKGDIEGRSVTDLEIDFGVFQDPDQRRRSLFFLRDPLPYDTMGEYAARFSVAHDTEDKDAAAHADRLAVLKARISNEFGDRRHRYAAAWNVETNRVTGLDEFGKQVEEAIWAQLEAELAEAAAPTELSWQEQEARVLDEFAADSRSDFQGRNTLLDDIAALIASPTQEGADWALCLTGPPGTGKSAVFAELLVRQQTTSALVLAHAAGASPRAPSVDAMLRRWIGDLSVFLNELVELADNADIETVDRNFASVLGRAAAQRRVVVLLDALDQFEPTPRGRFLTWLPTLWPPNARLFVTAIPGDGSTALARRPGTATRAIPALTEVEARAIFAAIHARYHRTPDAAVLAALMQKPEVGWSNPLWLYLAVEQANLLDEDDVALAERAYDTAWRTGKRLQALLLDRVAVFPADLQGLYCFTFNHAARRFPGLAPAFLGLIAVGAAGWRESDFRAVLPGVSGEAWDDLRFAYLRRLFRGQLRPRGALEQWDVAHAQMRSAIRAWLSDRGVAEPDLHAALARHLLGLPIDDPLRATETMRHLLGAGQLAPAAVYYADRSLPDAAAAGATRFLADAWLADQPATPARAQLADMLVLPDLPSAIAGLLAHRLLFDLRDAIAAEGLLASVRDLLTLLIPALVRLAAQDPRNAGWQRDLAVSQGKIGEVQEAQGNLSAALTSYQIALAISDQLAQVDPGDDGWQRDLAVSHSKIGEVQEAQGNLPAALTSYQAALAISDRLAQADPGNAGWQRDLAASHNRIGDVQQAQGNLAAALTSYQASLAISARLAQADPGNADWQRNLTVSHSRIGDVREALGNLAAVLTSYQASLVIADRLVKADPGNARWQRDLGGSRARIGDVQRAQGNLPAALTSYQADFAITDRLAKADPGNAGWQRDLAASHKRIGEVKQAQGNLVAALTS